MLLAVGPVASVRAQPVQGDVRSVGFQAGVESRFVVRNGQWFPILVELTGQGTQAYDVELRCERVDLDGDRVTYVEPHVVVNPDTPKRVWCYAVTLKENAAQPMKLDIIGDDRALIIRLPMPAFEPISNDTQLILDVSDQRFTGLDAIKSPKDTYFAPNWGGRRHYRSICVATLPARDLPDRWWGLEAVDVIVWDEPDPDQLSPAQLEALVQWVRSGGQLVVGIGPAWTRIQKSVLAEIMPLRGGQSPVEVRRLVTFERRFARGEAQGFKGPISVALGEPVKDALVTFQDRLPDNRVVSLIALRCVGSGRVIATAARLRDLRELRPSREFYKELFDLNANEPAFLKKEGEGAWSLGFGGGLYEPLIERIEFRRAATARVLAAFAFVAAYILLSTFGVWTWLKRHSLAHVSWAAFAAFAVVASLLSLGAVGLSRGVTGTVHNISFVDLEAGSGEARATSYFGYKSNRRQGVDLSLPVEDGYLRPLATGGEIDSVDYATPERYDAVPVKATLVGTPMRATLKQFEGFWQGELEGSIRGSLTARRDSGRITPQSWLQNDLDLDFIGGYLLYVDPRLRERDGGVPYRVAGLNTRTDRRRYYGSEKVPPAINVLALRIPALNSGQKLNRLGTSQDAEYNEYGIYDQAHARWQTRSKPDPRSEPMLWTLHRRQVDQWAPSLGRTLLGSALEPSDAAALLASTRNLYLHNSDVNEFDSVGRPISTAGLVDQDVTHWLTRGRAVLLLLSEAPGPATLHLDGKPKVSKEGRSIYRVRVPIQYTGRPPRGNTP